MQSFMLQSNKHDDKGNVALFKARHVIDGRGQTNYQYDIDTYAPNMQKNHLDVCAAWLFKKTWAWKQMTLFKHSLCQH